VKTKSDLGAVTVVRAKGLQIAAEGGGCRRRAATASTGL